MIHRAQNDAGQKIRKRLENTRAVAHKVTFFNCTLSPPFQYQKENQQAANRGCSSSK